MQVHELSDYSSDILSAESQLHLVPFFNLFAGFPCGFICGLIYSSNPDRWSIFRVEIDPAVMAFLLLVTRKLFFKSPEHLATLNYSSWSTVAVVGPPLNLCNLLLFSLFNFTSDQAGLECSDVDILLLRQFSTSVLRSIGTAVLGNSLGL